MKDLLTPRALDRLPRVAGLFVALVGCAVLVGWWGNIAALKSAVPGTVTMKPNTALGLGVIGAALFLLNQPSWPHARFPGRLLAALALLIGALTFVEYASGLDFAIDQVLIAPDPADLSLPAPGRMAPATALCLAIGGLALLLIKAKPRWTQLLSLPVLGIAALSIVGHIFDVRSFYNVAGFTSVAPHTAVGLFALAVGVLAASTTEGFMRVLASETLGGILFRRLLVLPLTVLATGWLALQGSRMGLYDPQFRLALMVVIGMAVSLLATGLVAIHLDAADRERRDLFVRLEAQVRERALAASIIASSDDAVVSQTLDGKVLSWNSGAERVFGFCAEEMVGESILRLFPTDRVNEEASFIAEIRAGHGISNYQTRRLRKDGTLIDISVSLSPIRDGKGEVFAVSKIARDISGQLRQQASELAAAIVDHSEDAIYSDDLDGAVLSWNRGAEKLYGYAKAEMVGGSIGRLFPPGLERDQQHFIAELTAGREISQFETRRLRSDGTVIDVSMTVSGIHDASGKLVALSKVARDITARKRAEAVLRESEERFYGAFNYAVIGMALVAPDGRWLKVNEALCGLVGYSEQELMQSRFQDITHPDDLERDLGYLRQMLAGEIRTYQMEKRYYHKDGRIVWVLLSVSLVRDSKGAPAYFVSQIENITERMRLHRELEQTTRHFEKILEHAPAMIGTWNADLTARFANRTYASTYGLTPEEMKGRYVADVLGAQVYAKSKPFIDAALKGTPQSFDREVVLPDGSVRFDRVEYVPDLRSDEGALYVFVTDITQRKRAELELAATGSLLRAVLDSASEVSIIAVEPDKTIKVFNRGAEKLLGYSSAEVVGRATPALIHDGREIEARARELSAAVGHQVPPSDVFSHPAALGQPGEWTYVTKDGRHVSVSLVVTAMRREDGTPLGYVGVAYDVSRQKQIEESLRDAIAKAQQANAAKSRFLANMSHEIRTPMNAVMGLSYLLDQTPLSDEQAGYLRKISIASKSLLSIINDILDLSKIEAGELTIERASFRPRELLGELYDVMVIQAEAKRIFFSVNVSEQVPESLLGDCTRLRQILVNLASNAIKFTESGGVALRVAVAETSAHGIRAQFVVQDTGIGIAPDVQDRMFDPFSQADASTTRRFGGTGLGLSIVKRLTELMGGRVWLRSMPGVGSSFWVEIEFDVPSESELASAEGAAAAGDVEAYRLDGVRVLVVDDSEVNLEVARKILERAGAVVTLASDGREACDRLGAAPESFDIVLMDVQMPVMDGHDATRVIRNELGLTALPIIALTAGALSSERQHARSAGMNDFVSKPFEVPELLRAIRRHARPAGRAGARAAGPESQAERAAWPHIDGIDLAAVRVRLGDDSRLFRGLFKRMLVEFAALGPPVDGDSPGALRSHASYMHKLKGVSGLLGATAVHALAADAEAACRAGDGGRLHAILPRLSETLQALRANAATLLAHEDESVPTPTDARLQRQQLEELLAALRDSRFSAIEYFESLATALRAHLGAEAFAALREHVERMEFKQAAAMLGAPAS